MGKKAFLVTSRVRRSPLAGLPPRVLSAAGLATPSAAAPKRTRRVLPQLVAFTRQTAPKGSPKGNIVLGIDPGTLRVGYGAIEVAALGLRYLESGVIRADRRAAVPFRLGQIQRQVSALIDRIRPTVVIVERAFAALNVQSALRIGEGRGVVLACAASFGSQVVEISPASAKKAIVGHGAADKTQVAKMAAAALGLREPPRPLDASDALALALAHVWSSHLSSSHVSSSQVSSSQVSSRMYDRRHGRSSR
jgi:crossover junction endodeoxyribonuclease RuvC